LWPTRARPATLGGDDIPEAEPDIAYLIGVLTMRRATVEGWENESSRQTVLAALDQLISEIEAGDVRIVSGKRPCIRKPASGACYQAWKARSQPWGNQVLAASAEEIRRPGTTSLTSPRDERGSAQAAAVEPGPRPFLSSDDLQRSFGDLKAAGG
jgi:hypothetical protein